MQKAQEVLEQSSSELREISTLTKGSYAWITMCISLYNVVGHITCDKMEISLLFNFTIKYVAYRVCTTTLHNGFIQRHKIVSVTGEIKICWYVMLCFCLMHGHVLIDGQSIAIRLAKQTTESLKRAVATILEIGLKDKYINFQVPTME